MATNGVTWKQVAAVVAILAGFSGLGVQVSGKLYQKADKTELKRVENQSIERDMFLQKELCRQVKSIEGKVDHVIRILIEK